MQTISLPSLICIRAFKINYKNFNWLTRRCSGWLLPTLLTSSNAALSPQLFCFSSWGLIPAAPNLQHHAFCILQRLSPLACPLLLSAAHLGGSHCIQSSYQAFPSYQAKLVSMHLWPPTILVNYLSNYLVKVCLVKLSTPERALSWPPLSPLPSTMSSSQ